MLVDADPYYLFDIVADPIQWANLPAGTVATPHGFGPAGQGARFTEIYRLTEHPSAPVEWPVTWRVDSYRRPYLWAVGAQTSVPREFGGFPVMMTVLYSVNISADGVPCLRRSMVTAVDPSARLSRELLDVFTGTALHLEILGRIRHRAERRSAARYQR
ncbi:hypothetical protein NS14008_19415 [Nocardia seriolae]|nr:hypothetical protein NS14008_19415 [Nocardia seriolae]PSK32880.1 hypothetical protein C6575_02245 [Nocardia seriolae]RLP23557.1 hypothetical protein D6158_34770 [Nocardia seriolae]